MDINGTRRETEMRGEGRGGGGEREGSPWRSAVKGE